MLCVPSERLPVVQVAVRELPAPATADAAQPAIEATPSLKFTLPVGAVPATLAVKVTFAPTVDGFSELMSVVVLAVCEELTTCDNGELLDAALAPSPEYAATMVCVPELNAAVVHTAVRVLPAPVSAAPPQPLMVVPPSVKFRVPVGPLPVTDPVNMTTVPTVDGFAELDKAAVVAVLLTTCGNDGLLDALLAPSPEYAA